MKEFTIVNKNYSEQLESMLEDMVDQILEKKGYLPLDLGYDKLEGRTISIDEFRKRFCGGRSATWVKTHIFYPFQPSWVVDVHPGKGQAYTIFAKPAAKWMEKNRDKINWKGGE